MESSNLSLMGESPPRGILIQAIDAPCPLPGEGSWVCFKAIGSLKESHPLNCHSPAQWEVSPSWDLVTSSTALSFFAADFTKRADTLQWNR